jgi:hypothetical protein
MRHQTTRQDALIFSFISFTDTFVPMIYMKDNGVEPLTVKVKRTTTFQKIYNAVAQEKRAELTSFRLCHDGNQLPRDETTPDDVRLPLYNFFFFSPLLVNRLTLPCSFFQSLKFSGNLKTKN